MTKEKRREYNRRYREKHREALLAYDRARYKTKGNRGDPDRRRQLDADRKRKRWAVDPDWKAKALVHNAAWRERHREEHLARRRADYVRNTARYRADARGYWWRHHDRVLAKQRGNASGRYQRYKVIYVRVAMARRARLKGALHIERVDRHAIYRRDGGVCHICRKVVSVAAFTLDHLVPLACGGEHASFNLAVAHRSCNRKKWHHRVPVQVPLPLVG